MKIVIHAWKNKIASAHTHTHTHLVMQRNPNVLLTWLLSEENCVCVYICMTSGKYIKAKPTLRFHIGNMEYLLHVLMLFSLVFATPLK